MQIQGKTSAGDAVRTASTASTQAATDKGANPLDNVTVPQALAYISANVTTLAGVLVVLPKIVAYLVYLDKRVKYLEALQAQKNS